MFFNKKSKKSKDELVGKQVLYSINSKEPYNLEGEIVAEYMMSVRIKDNKTGKLFIKNAGQYKLKWFRNIVSFFLVI